MTLKSFFFPRMNKQKGAQFLHLFWFLNNKIIKISLTYLGINCIKKKMLRVEKKRNIEKVDANVSSLSHQNGTNLLPMWLKQCVSRWLPKSTHGSCISYVLFNNQ